MAYLAAQAHDSSSAFLTTSQAHKLKRDALETYARILRELETASLSKSQRVAFYAVGAAEALLLDKVSSNWHERYLDSRMDLGIFFLPRRT